MSGGRYEVPVLWKKFPPPASQQLQLCSRKTGGAGEMQGLSSDGQCVCHLYIFLLRIVCAGMTSSLRTRDQTCNPRHNAPLREISSVRVPQLPRAHHQCLRHGQQGRTRCAGLLRQRGGLQSTIGATYIRFYGAHSCIHQGTLGGLGGGSRSCCTNGSEGCTAKWRTNIIGTGTTTQQRPWHL